MFSYLQDPLNIKGKKRLKKLIFVFYPQYPCFWCCTRFATVNHSEDEASMPYTTREILNGILTIARCD